MALRDAVLAHGNGALLHGLVLNIDQPASPSLLQNCVWALSNFVRAKPPPPPAVCAAAAPAIVRVLNRSDVGDDVSGVSLDTKSLYWFLSAAAACLLLDK